MVYTQQRDFQAVTKFCCGLQNQKITRLILTRLESLQNTPASCTIRAKKKGQPSGNPLGKNPSDYWAIISQEWENGIIEIPNVKSNHPEKTAHPCQFPIELIERCVLALTNENDWVLDPFGGVGSSLIAA